MIINAWGVIAFCGFIQQKHIGVSGDAVRALTRSSPGDRRKSPPMLMLA
ncbi:hypothetical protein CIT292_08588 [Citrobacter youngae ATCC 29220]|uniref:Uncharacterized protein n=1 Tax=Citrobacter youngae ATCC 29220 TaxID=500640 RepID=D4BDM1_9ENTR|nr:hypothetical protein CIT292_08588 [Citrobacter youngae ATCC 29220]